MSRKIERIFKGLKIDLEDGFGALTGSLKFSRVVSVRPIGAVVEVVTTTEGSDRQRVYLFPANHPFTYTQERLWDLQESDEESAT